MDPKERIAQDEKRLSRVEKGGRVLVKSSMGVVEYEAAVSCGGKEGRWICATHKCDFANQFQKDTHIHVGTHKLAWYCYACYRVEVP